MAFIYSIKRIIALLITAILTIGIGAYSPAKPVVSDPENCKLAINVVSDVHVEGNNMPTYYNYRKILRTMAKSDAQASVFLGDNTMNGQDFESLLFYGALAKAGLPGEQIVLCGNHDAGFEKSDGGYDKLYKRYSDYNNYMLGAPVDGPLFCREIGGYYFIVINPVEKCLNELPLNDEVLTFLDSSLAKATAEGKPAFVLSHWPYQYTDDYGASIVNITDKYDNVFYLSGHTHSEMYNPWTFNTRNGINSVNLPRCTENYGKDGNDSTGWGVRLEVYENEVYARSFNFITGEYNPNLEYHFAIV